MTKKGAYSAEAHRANPVPQRIRSARWAAKNPEKVAANKKNWLRKNGWRYAEIFARRKAERMQRTAAWADEFVIREIYELSFLRTIATGVKHNVDHIVPMKSDLVCGLHCEANLQVIP